jgi:hypothetical protein
MLTLITMTGNRPEAWSLCEYFMSRQTFQGLVHWIIVDDGENAQPITFEREGWTLEIIRPEPFWEAGQNTQTRNIRAALEVTTPVDRIAFIEDDDWYSPNWLSIIDAQLHYCDLVGERFAFYYNLKTQQYCQLHNGMHSGLCSTGIKGQAIEDLKKICEVDRKFIDIELWKTQNTRRLFNSKEVIGMKGLPGRGGIGMGHKPQRAFKSDFSGVVLRKMIGADADLYFNLKLN